MTNISLPFSGGTVKLPYEIVDCEGEKNIRFEKNTVDTWYEMGSGVTFITVTCSATTESRTGTITPYFNDAACETISVSQKGESVCDCSALSNVDFNYIIPASGASSGTVVGTYTLDGGCVDSVTVTADLGLEILAQGGKFTLNKDVPQNPRSDEMIEYALTVKYNEEACVNDSIVQEASEVECSCEGITKIVHSVHRYFSNLGNEENPGYKYTNLQNVLIASATTACGEFKADAKNSTMLSDVVSGTTVGEDKVLIVREGNKIYVYVTVLENPGGTNRSTPIELYFRKKEESGYTYCNGKALYLYQSGNESDYASCEYEMNKRKPCDMLEIDEDTLGIGYLELISYYNNSSSSYDDYRLRHSSGHRMIIPKISEVGYINGSLDVYEDYQDLECGNWYYSKAYLSSTDKLIPETNADFDDWVTFEAKWLDFYKYYQLNFGFKEINTSTQHKYAKIDLHLYTEWDKDNEGGGVDCGTYRSVYMIQKTSACTECGSSKIHTEPSPIDASGVTESIHDYEITGRICDNNELIGARIDPSSAGTVSVNDGMINLEITPNASTEERDIKLYLTYEYPDGSTCELLEKEYSQKVDICGDCESLFNNVNHTYYESPISCGIEGESWHVDIGEDVAKWLYDKGPSIPYLTQQFICPDEIEAYFVLCDVDGVPFLPTSDIPSSSNYYQICEGNRLFYNRHYVIGKGVVINTIEYNNAVAIYYDGDTTKEQMNCSYYYMVQIYKNGELYCSSDVFAEKWRAVLERSVCDEPSCNLIYNGYTYATTTAQTEEGVVAAVIPKDGSATHCFNVNFSDGEEIIRPGFCRGYFKHFTASSTQAGVTVTTNGAAITVSAPRNEGDTYKRYTIDVAFSLEAPDGTRTICNDKGQTLYVVVDYK